MRPPAQQIQRPLRLRLYVDESGTAGPVKSGDTSNRYLGVVGVAIPQDERHDRFCERFEALKRKHLPCPHGADRDEPCILHREDIVSRRYRFNALRDVHKQKAFDEALLAAIDATDFVLYGVVLDKKSHQQKANYRQINDDYHYAMLALLQRYCGRMTRFNCEGDVMSEARGGGQDFALKAAYRQLAENGGPYFTDIRERLTSKEIKIKPKKANVLGLQLADLLARDVTRDVLAVHELGDAPTGFGKELIAVVEKKYNRKLSTGVVKGYGQVLLK